MKRVTIFLLAVMLTFPTWATADEVRCVVPSCVVCPPGAFLEAELCQGAPTGWNNGCTVRELRTVTCDTVICGASKVTATYRDTDWFRVDLRAWTDSVLLKWKAVAEFDVTVRIIGQGPGADSCLASVTIDEATAAVCDTAVASVCVAPGVYWLEVTPASSVTSLDCRNYVAQVMCSPCHPEPPCPVVPPDSIGIGDRFCLDFCGRPIKVYWCCPFDGQPVFSLVSGALPWTVQVPQRPDSSNGACPAPGGWWSAEFTAEGTGQMCWSFDEQLAVEMGTFDAIPGDNRITLRWNTLSESNNDRFDIERDGAVVARPRGLGDSPSGHSYQWVDEQVQSAVTYTYKLYSVDLNGTRLALATVSATPNSSPAAVTEYTLNQNYPNPFNPTTQITFDLVDNGPVTLTIFNPMGQVVTTLVNSTMTAGRHTVAFDAGSLPTGMYLYRLEAGSFTAARKMLLIK